MKSGNKITIKYIGSGYRCSFTNGEIYEANILPEKRYGKDMYSICDDSEEEYVYSLKYIINNFTILKNDIE